MSNNPIAGKNSLNELFFERKPFLISRYAKIEPDINCHILL